MMKVAKEAGLPFYCHCVKVVNYSAVSILQEFVKLGKVLLVMSSVHGGKSKVLPNGG
jgi:hypothetical protein